MASDLEAQRLAYIAERNALLKDLNISSKAQAIGKPQSNGTKRNSSSSSNSKPKGPPSKRIKRELDIAPRRTSSRLAGIQADSEKAEEKAKEEYEARREEERVKRMRNQENIDFKGSLVLGTDVLLKEGGGRRYERTFDGGITTEEDGSGRSSDKDLKKLRERVGGLKLWDGWDPARLKIVPERIYSMAMHPTQSKPIVFAGDKAGYLGIVDAGQKPGGLVKREEKEEEVKKGKRKGNADDEDDEDDDPDPVIDTIKPHTRTISAMHLHPSKPETLYTASYDSSIRATDLQKSTAVEVYGPEDASMDEPVSGIDMAATDPNVIYFTTLNGALGKYDTRTPAKDAEMYQLSEKKIGGFTLNPLAPHYLATASLDRTMKLWDLRKITKKLPTLVGEHESKLSVSHAAFNVAGQVATSSYDDSIKIHSFGTGGGSKKGTAKLEAMSTWAAGKTLDEEVMKPEVVIRHNNQTGMDTLMSLYPRILANDYPGRWVTILRPQWQRFPEDKIQKLVIGNMNRFVDVYAADGTQLAQLGDDEGRITAVPAVAVWHERKEWIAAGNASGKLYLFM